MIAGGPANYTVGYGYDAAGDVTGPTNKAVRSDTHATLRNALPQYPAAS